MSARLLARTTAVLARIDQTLGDPFPAAVARLMGPLDQPADVGDECWAAVTRQRINIPRTVLAELLDGDILGVDYAPPIVVECGYPTVTDIGLCAACYATLAHPQEPTPT